MSWCYVHIWIIVQKDPAGSTRSHFRFARKSVQMWSGSRQHACACDLYLQIKRQCDCVKNISGVQSTLPFSCISAGMNYNRAHIWRAIRPPALSERRRHTHTQSHWSLAKIALVFKPSELQLHSHAVRKPLSLGLFMSADVWTREAGRELKTLRTHDRSRKSRCYALSNLFSFLFELIKAVMLGFHISSLE